VKAIADPEPRALGFELPRRHGLNVDKQVVQPPGAGKAGIVSGVEHAVRLAEQALGMFQGQELNEAFGTDPRPAPEQALEMELAQVHAFGDLAQFRLAMVVFFQEENGFFNSGVIFNLGVHGFTVLRLILHHLEAIANIEQPDSCSFARENAGSIFQIIRRWRGKCLPLLKRLGV
jgi:hypothetical protein